VVEVQGLFIPNFPGGATIENPVSPDLGGAGMTIVDDPRLLALLRGGKTVDT